jgi:sugar lactone lactonase YvrE
VFVENIAPMADGGFVVSILSEARLDRVAPDGAVSTLAQLSQPPTGLALDGDTLYVSVGEPGQAPMTLWRIDPAGGAAEPWMEVAGAVFLNGLTWFEPGLLMASDSHQGRLYLIDIRSRQSRVWLEDERLTPAPGFAFLPGANGVKRNATHVYVSSTGRALLLRAPVLADGSAGSLELVAERLRVDDFAFDEAGAAYLTTHIGHSLDRLGPDGDRVSLGGVAEGMAGSTACAFGRGAGDDTALYVTTTGGIVGPPGGRLERAKLVRLDVGAKGRPLSPAPSP